MIQNDILSLTEYALKTGLIQSADKAYTRNRLLELFELDEHWILPLTCLSRKKIQKP